LEPTYERLAFRVQVLGLANQKQVSKFGVHFEGNLLLLVNKVLFI